MNIEKQVPPGLKTNGLYYTAIQMSLLEKKYFIWFLFMSLQCLIFRPAMMVFRKCFQIFIV